MERKISFAIYTLGCKVNQYESEKIVQEFLDCGFEMRDFSEAADIYVVNTCCVTAESARKSRKAARCALRRKNGSSNSLGCVVVTGCSVNSPSENFRKEIKADIYIPNSCKDRLVEEVMGYLGLSSGKAMVFPKKQRLHTRALVKVQDGCDEFCTYCIVPYVRGLPRSRNPGDILKEVEALVSSGTKEIVLTGINLGKYGKDFKGGYSLAKLLKNIFRLPHSFRVRLSSIELYDLNDELMNMAASGLLCRHFHIPLQSGSNKILKAMGRKYTAEDYLKKAKEIQGKIIDVALTTDVMVGFPGETEVDFNKTLRLVEEVWFRKIHVFQFSPRYGAKAFSLGDNVSSEVKKERAAILRNLGEKLAYRFFENFLGKEFEAVVEEKEKNGFLRGLTDNYLPVYFKGGERLKGSLVKVRIREIKKEGLFGELCEGREIHGRVCVL